MKLKQLLKVTDPKQRVHVKVYAYGVFYVSTVFYGMKTAEDVLAHACKDLLDAKVTFVIATTAEEAEIDFTVLSIQVELCKWPTPAQTFRKAG